MVLFIIDEKNKKKLRIIFFLVIWIFLLLLSNGPLHGAVLIDRQKALQPSRLFVNLPTPDPFKSTNKPAKGKFLVAGRHLKDPNFSESVVLLLDYNWYGALGLVINRPTEFKLSKVLPDLKNLHQRTDTVFVGGPVAVGQILLLIQSNAQPHESIHVFKDIYVSSSRSVLEQITNKTEKGEKFRAYVGHAGWASGQLEQELSRGDWRVIPGDRESVFSELPSQVWPQLIRRSSGKWTKIQAPKQNTAVIYSKPRLCSKWEHPSIESEAWIRDLFQFLNKHHLHVSCF